MVEKKRRQGQYGANPKTICPKCDKEYLKSANGRYGKAWKRIGQYCPDPACDYMEKDFVELEDLEEETEDNIDKAEKIKQLTAEFVKKHEELNRLAELIKELETE
jgi:hypothetical protein